MGFDVVQVQGDPASFTSDKLVTVTMLREATSETTYFLLVDLSNGSGDWKHYSGAYVSVVAGAGKGTKTGASDKWGVQIGVVMEIDGTDATITWLPIGSVSLKDTSRFSSDQQLVDLFPGSAPQSKVVVSL